MGYRNYSDTVGLIVDKDGNGDFSTISLAIAAAVSGDTIFVGPGTYTENPVLKSGINITAHSGDAIQGNVIINGKCTYSGSGAVTISNIQLQTNGDFLLAVSGSANSTVNLVGCLINCSNNTGIDNTSSGSSVIHCYNTIANVGTTGIALYSIAAASGGLQFNACQLTNSGLSTTANNVSAGSVNFFHSDVFIPISTSSGGFGTMYHCILNTSNENVTFLTTAGTGNYVVTNCALYSGTASAISIGSGTTVVATSNTIDSSNTDVIAGSGTLAYGALTCTDSDTLAGTLTLVPYTTIP